MYVILEQQDEGSGGFYIFPLSLIFGDDPTDGLIMVGKTVVPISKLAIVRSI